MHPTNRGKQRPPRRTILRVLSTRRHVRHQTSLQSTCSCLVWVKRNTWENGLEPNTSTFNIQETTKDRTAQFERTTRCHLQPAAASGEQTLPGPPEPEVPLPARVPGLRDQLCCSHIRLPVPRAQDRWKESLSLTHTHFFFSFQTGFILRINGYPNLKLTSVILGLVSLYSHNQRENTAFLYQLHFEKISIERKILINWP